MTICRARVLVSFFKPHVIVKMKIFLIGHIFGGILVNGGRWRHRVQQGR